MPTIYPCLRKSLGGVPGILIYSTANPSGEVIITEFMRQQTPYDCTETAFAVALRALNLTQNLSATYSALYFSNSYPADLQQLRKILRNVVRLTNGTANITHYGPNPANVDGVVDAPFPPPRPLPPLTLRVILFHYVGIAGQGHTITINKILNDTQTLNITIGGNGVGPGGGRTPRPFIVNTIEYFDPADGMMHTGKIARADFPTPYEGPNDEGDEYLQLADGTWTKVEDAVDIKKNN